MSTFGKSVTCVTKVVHRRWHTREFRQQPLFRRNAAFFDHASAALRYRHRDDAVAQQGFMLCAGWRLTSLMLFLAPGASGPEVITVITGGKTGAQRAGRPTTSRDHQGSENLSPRRRWRGPRARAGSHHARPVFICAGIYRIHCIPLQIYLTKKTTFKERP